MYANIGYIQGNVNKPTQIGLCERLSQTPLARDFTSFYPSGRNDKAFWGRGGRRKATERSPSSHLAHRISIPLHDLTGQ